MLTWFTRSTLVSDHEVIMHSFYDCTSIMLMTESRLFCSITSCTTLRSWWSKVIIRYDIINVSIGICCLKSNSSLRSGVISWTYSIRLLRRCHRSHWTQRMGHRCHKSIVWFQTSSASVQLISTWKGRLGSSHIIHIFHWTMSHVLCFEEPTSIDLQLCHFSYFLFN